MNKAPQNQDCRNYAPLDVAKGICHERKQVVLADGEACELFVELPKCKCCGKYIPGEQEFLGVCSASPSRPMTYPDLVAVTCEWFTRVET